MQAADWIEDGSSSSRGGGGGGFGGTSAMEVAESMGPAFLDCTFCDEALNGGAHFHVCTFSNPLLVLLILLIPS